MLERLPHSHRTICAGDFNSHLSTEAWKDHELTGKRGLQTPTSRLGHHLVEFVQENNLHIVDRRIPCKLRGIWWNASNKKWYENDTFLSDGIFTPGAWHRLTTRTIAGCDHRAKALEMNMMGRHVQWHKPKKEGEVELNAFGEGKNRHRIRWDQTRGGSDLAAEAKHLYHDELRKNYAAKKVRTVLHVWTAVRTTILGAAFCYGKRWPHCSLIKQIKYAVAARCPPTCRATARIKTKFRRQKKGRSFLQQLMQSQRKTGRTSYESSS